MVVFRMLWIILFILSHCDSFLGDESGMYKKLSECLAANITCVVSTDEFVAEPETADINLAEDSDYTISSEGIKTLTLNLKKVYVKGTLTFDSLKVYYS
jgi:hypothetical protein